jgi:RNA polymerase sigma-70 factor (ECF subfamily)
VNDSAGVNRQSEREDNQPSDGGRAPVVSGEALVAELATVPARDRASVFRARVGGSLDAAYRRAAVLLGNRFEAEDAVHDAAERAWRSWGSLRDETQFDAWFGRILINVCRDRLRKRRRVAVIEVREAVDATDQTAERHVNVVGERARIVDMLAALSADERIVIALRYEADLTIPEIARLIGAPEGTVKSRLHHAIQKLRERLQTEDER